MTTKDNWIKASSEILLSVMEDYTGDSESNFPDAEAKLHNLISQVENDAIEKTNKRWRLKAKKLMKPTKEGKGDYTDFTTSTGTRDTLLQWSYNQALSDLLEDKKGEA